MTGYMQDAARALKENEELRKEIGRLRDALLHISGIRDQDCYAVAIAKEALE